MKRGWERGWKGMMKKASLRSNTVKKFVVRGMADRRLRIRDYWECWYGLIDFFVGLGPVSKSLVPPLLPRWGCCVVNG